MSQHETPLFTGLVEHASKNPVQFHIPGHKKGAGMDPDFRKFIGENALSIDLINIAPLDDLHHPKSMILKAQELAAEAFHADYTFFSVQGTSGAIIAMIMSVVGPGEKIIVPRNVHKSIMSAIIFSGAKPVFIHPEIDENLGISHGVTTHAVEKALELHPDAKGLLVINPTYYGYTTDLKKVVEIAHSYDIPVLVDEAHGVHLPFNEKLPLSAMQAGADLAATSVHKLGGSLTQSSILNLKEGLVKKERVQAVLSMLTTTSTSYILLSSLDCARKYLATEGHNQLDRSISLANWTRSEINKIPYLYCPGEDILGRPETFNFDPSKLIISVKKLGVTGHDVEVWLRENYNIEVELSDLYNILCLVTLGESEDDLKLLIKALKHLVEEFKHFAEEGKVVKVDIPDIPSLAISPREAFYATTERIKINEAAGRIIAEFIMVYPPGIPIYIPGEIITDDLIEYIKRNKDAELPVQGPEDPEINYLRVIKAEHAIR
ncbi:MAG: Lysine decarboxylase [Bacillales bacterium]|jgi:lysine decarboxylase|nr:Lysine decarboxylase [Bacillales bacterium]